MYIAYLLHLIIYVNKLINLKFVSKRALSKLRCDQSFNKTGSEHAYYLQISRVISNHMRLTAVKK